jgi:hypothetical protein
VILVSDFLGETNPGRAAMRAHLKRKVLHSETLGRLSQTTLNQVGRRHDVIALQVGDPREQSLPDVGRLLLQDAETGEVVEINTSDVRRREAFETRSRKAQKELDRLFRGARVDHLKILTPAAAEPEDAYMGELVAFFEGRQKRRRR